MTPLVDEALAVKVARIAGSIPRIAKTERHPQGWMFAPVAAVIDAVRAGMAQEGIAVVPVKVAHRMREVGRTKSGAPTWSHRVRVTWAVTDGRETWSVPMEGLAFDSSDKGFNKALTACRKNLMLSLFQLSAGDDPDGHDPEVGERPPVRVKQRRQGPPPGASVEPALWQKRAQALLESSGAPDTFKQRMQTEGIPSTDLGDDDTFARAERVAAEVRAAFDLANRTEGAKA